MSAGDWQVAFNLWRWGFDTFDIASYFHVPEWVIYNNSDKYRRGVDNGRVLRSNTGQTSKPPPPTKAEITRRAWEDTLMELKAETNIPTIGYSYFDTKNEFEVRLRGTRDQYMRTEYGEMRFLQRGIYPRLHKNFNFKGEGKSPTPAATKSRSGKAQS